MDARITSATVTKSNGIFGEYILLSLTVAHTYKPIYYAEQDFILYKGSWPRFAKRMYKSKKEIEVDKHNRSSC